MEAGNNKRDQYFMPPNILEKYNACYKWLDEFYKDLSELLNIISNRLKSELPFEPDKNQSFYSYSPTSKKVLHNPIFKWGNCELKGQNYTLVIITILGWETTLHTLKNLKVSESNEPVIVIVAVRHPQEIKINGQNVWGLFQNINKRYGNKFDGSTELEEKKLDLWGFAVPLYAFSRQKLEERAKKETIGLEQALDKTIEELIVNPLNKLLGL